MDKLILFNSTDKREFNLLAKQLKLFLCDGSFEKLYYILPENDGWVTSGGFKIIECINSNNDVINIDFSQIVKLDNVYVFLINGNLVKRIRNYKIIKISGIKKFTKDNFISLNVVPKFSNTIGKDLRQLSFFPIIP